MPGGVGWQFIPGFKGAAPLDRIIEGVWIQIATRNLTIEGGCKVLHFSLQLLFIEIIDPVIPVGFNAAGEQAENSLFRLSRLDCLIGNRDQCRPISSWLIQPVAARIGADAA